MNIVSTALYRQGASHINKGIVCQDYANLAVTDDGTLVLAISDGHGSNKYFRSEVGSRLAVETAIETVKEFLSEFDADALLPRDVTFDTIAAGPAGLAASSGPISAEADAIFRHLGGAIIYRWQRKVLAHWVDNPPAEEEMKRLKRDEIAYYAEGKKQNIVKAYGCTLQVAVRSPNYWFVIHIGDGRIVVADADGHISEPVPWDPDCFGTTTTSMCELNPGSVRFIFSRDMQSAAAIFLASDGMDDSFVTAEQRASVYGVNILAEIQATGWSEFTSSLPAFLDMVSKHYSGDDMSLACWVDLDAIAGMLPTIYATDIRRVDTEIDSLDHKINVTKDELNILDEKKRSLLGNGDSVKRADGDLDRIEEILNSTSDHSRTLLNRLLDAVAPSRRMILDKQNEIKDALTKIDIEAKLRRDRLEQFTERRAKYQREKDNLATQLNALGIGQELTQQRETTPDAILNHDTDAPKAFDTDGTESENINTSNTPEDNIVDEWQ